MHSVFGQHLQIRHCSYHLARATWTKILAFGLQTIYRENGGGVHAFLMLTFSQHSVSVKSPLTPSKSWPGIESRSCRDPRREQKLRFLYLCLATNQHSTTTKCYQLRRSNVPSFNTTRVTNKLHLLPRCHVIANQMSVEFCAKSLRLHNTALLASKRNAAAAASALQPVSRRPATLRPLLRSPTLQLWCD